MSKFFRPGKPGGDRNSDKKGSGRPFKKKDFSKGDDKPSRFKSSGDRPVSSRKEFDSWKKSADSGENKDKPAYKSQSRSTDRPYNADRKSEKSAGDRGFKRDSESKGRFNKPAGDRPARPAGRNDNWKKRTDFDKSADKPREDKPFSERKESDKWRRKPAPESLEDFGASEDKPRSESYGRPYEKKKFVKSAGKKNFKRTTTFGQGEKTESDLIRLNKYLANAGVSSRREADKLIESGIVTVNGKVITELGYKITPGDEVKFGGAILRKEKPVYILLNKPKDYITTSKDPQERRTVMHLIEGACKERVYPVGRLDRMTTGLLLFTNDGEMAKRLTHPSHGAKKMYHVSLDQNLSLADMKSIQQGVELEDGKAEVDAIEFVEGAGRKEVGVELHSGRNRVVRRIFESLGYKVVKLDRVTFAGLTKKDLQRGYWRKLSEKEVGMLMMRQ